MKNTRCGRIARKLLSQLLCTAILLALVPCLSSNVRAAEEAAQPAFATREYVVSEIVQSAGRGTMGKSDRLLSAFTDADEIGEEYSDDLSRAVNAGILRGYGDGTLHPKDNIRRIEALVMLSRILPDAEAIRDPIGFSDVPAWAKEDIDRLSAAGVVNGYGDGRLGSDDFITVEQVGLLTDRSDALLNRYTPGESFYNYVNDKFFRNYLPGDYELDPLYGVVTPGEYNQNAFMDLADEILEQEDELLRSLGSGELEYEKGSPAQRLYDLYETWTFAEEDCETDLAWLKGYTDLLLDADTPEAFLDASAAVYRETGAATLFSMDISIDYETGNPYPCIEAIPYNYPAILAFDPESEKEYSDDCLKALKDYADTFDRGFTAKDAEAAYELQKQLGSATDYYQYYVDCMNYAYDCGDLPEWDEDDLFLRRKALRDWHPEFFGEDADTEEHTLTLQEASEVFSDPLLDVVSLLSDVGFHDFDHMIATQPFRSAAKDVRITEENLNAWKLTAVFNLSDELSVWASQEQNEAAQRFAYYCISAAYCGAYTLEEFKSWDSVGEDTADGEDEEAQDGESEDADEPEPFEDVIRDIADPLIPYDVGRLWCEHCYDPDFSEDVRKLVEEIMNAYRERFGKTEWLDEQSRAGAEKKLDNMLAFIGWRDDDSPDILSHADGGTYLINTAGAKANYLKNSIRACADRTYYREFLFTGFDVVNAYYSINLNCIMIPSSFLGGAFYDPDASYARNMGSIGMVIAHEIGHAFDDDGSKFDENGAEVNWWSEESAAAYEALTDRFLTYYAGYEAMRGVPQDAEVSLGENMADFSAMTIVTDILAGDPDALRSALEAYAVMWAEVLSDNSKTWFLSNEHAANQVRVNAVVASLDCFYELYDISEDDPMYVAPEDRLRLW